MIFFLNSTVLFNSHKKLPTRLRRDSSQIVCSFKVMRLFLDKSLSVLANTIQIGNPGDIVYNANPEAGGTVGWVYTTNNLWKTFGDISS